MGDEDGGADGGAAEGGARGDKTEGFGRIVAFAERLDGLTWRGGGGLTLVPEGAAAALGAVGVEWGPGAAGVGELEAGAGTGGPRGLTVGGTRGLRG